MEHTPIYDVGGSLPVSLDAFRNRPCALPYSHAAYVPPTPGEVDRLIDLAGWSQTVTAKLVGVTYNPKKGSSTVRKWRAAVEKDDSREIPYSAWRLMLIYAGVVSVSDGLDAAIAGHRDTAGGDTKTPIPLSVSGVAYVTTDGVIRYFTSGPGVELPADFKEFAPVDKRIAELEAENDRLSRSKRRMIDHQNRHGNALAEMRDSGEEEGGV